MAIQIGNLQIRRVLIADDNPQARQAFGLRIEDLDLQAVVEDGPLVTVDELMQKARNEADAVLCDYHLKKRNYSAFDGDDFVAKCYQAGIPAILCTSFEDTDIAPSRSIRRYIPSFLSSRELGEAAIEEGWEKCVREFQGNFPQERKASRTQIRIAPMDDGDDDHCYVVLPGWDSLYTVKLARRDIPTEFHRYVEPGRRFHARVNICAERPADLFFEFESWELG